MTDSVNRRSLLAGFSASSLLTLTGCVGSLATDDAEFPDQEIRMVVPFSPGGGYDTYARIVAEHIEVPMRVDNVTGALGDVAKEQVYTAEPDGYTVMITGLSIYPSRQLTDDMPYDVTAMTTFPQVVDEPLSIGGHPELVDDWEHFVELVNDEEIRFAGSQGGQVALATSTIGYFADLWEPSKILDNLVSIVGTSEMMSAIQRGDVDAVVGNPSSQAPYAESGDFAFWMLINAGDPSTLDAVPDDTPTLQSEGISNRESIEDVLTNARVFMGPPEIPEDRRTVLENAFLEALQSQALQDDLASAGRPMDVLPGPETEEKIMRMFDGLKELPFLDEFGS